MKKWKKWSLTLLLVLLAVVTSERFTDAVDNRRAGDEGAGQVASAFKDKRSRVWVKFEARVVKLLRDDNEGSRHQRFIVRLESGHSLLVSHNIDLAPRIPLRKQSDVLISGRYEWNPKGGVVHWTHHDPQGEIEGGWIEFEGKKYQ